MVRFVITLDFIFVIHIIDDFERRGCLIKVSLYNLHTVDECKSAKNVEL
jgi:hypothetical protein